MNCFEFKLGIFIPSEKKANAFLQAFIEGVSIILCDNSRCPFFAILIDFVKSAISPDFNTINFFFN